MLHKPRFATHPSLAGVVTVIVTALPAFAQAADPAQEAATSGVHAGLAAQAATIGNAR
jgi:mannose/fructose/N-acetylgalactosamine-specific phosphotransferase system component IID